MTGLIYVVLAAREHIACWIFGIISCAFIAWDDFTAFKLYADGVLQIIYVVLGVVGLVRWLTGKEGAKEMVITTRTPVFHLKAVILALVVSIPIAYVLSDIAGANYGYPDTVTTVLSLYATWLLINKVAENWLFWIVIDAIYIYLFYSTGGVIVAVLYGIFMIVAAYGYLEWSKRRKQYVLIETASK